MNDLIIILIGCAFLLAMFTLMWYVDAYPFHRAGRTHNAIRSPIPNRDEHWKPSPEKRLDILKNSGICVIRGDDDNPTEVMDRIPKNFPYIIVYPSYSHDKLTEVADYGEALWSGWIDYYGTRQVPVWYRINPDNKNTPSISEPKNSGAMDIVSIMKVEHNGIIYKIPHHAPSESNIRESSVTSYTGSPIGGGRRSLIDRWGSVL